MHRLFAATVLALGLATTAQAWAGSEAPDTVILNNGQRIRGVVTQADPDRGTTLVLPDGTVRRFRASDVARVVFEDKSKGQAPPPPVEKPTPRPEPRPTPRYEPRETPRPAPRYEAPDDDDRPRVSRRSGLRLGLQIQGGPFIVTSGSGSRTGGQFGGAARFGYQFDPTFELHWEPAASVGIDRNGNAVIVWNSLIAELHLTRSFFVAAGPGLAATWIFPSAGATTQGLNFAAVARLGFDIQVSRHSRSAVSLALEGRLAIVDRGTLIFPAFAIGYDFN